MQGDATGKELFAQTSTQKKIIIVCVKKKVIQKIMVPKLRFLLLLQYIIKINTKLQNIWFRSIDLPLLMRFGAHN